jgi:hypothetical protein
MKGPMKLIDASSGLMECGVCGSRHNARLQSGSDRADGQTNFYRGSWQCSDERCPSKLAEGPPAVEAPAQPDFPPEHSHSTMYFD